MSQPRLLLGPLLRYVDRHDATIWVETDRACTVRVGVGERVVDERTWSVHGHHYALVQVRDLEPDSVLPYTVQLDETPVWPEPDSPWPPSVVRTLGDDAQLRLAFGSCRRVAPFDEDGLEEFGADALVALAERMRDAPHEQWPDALFMAGDQIYADEPSPELVERLKQAHRPVPPERKDVAQEVWNFEEYTWLYYESWTPEPVRWLLSTVPTCMLLDDHDLRDDWNTSAAWRAEVTAAPWWRDRVVGAFASYWVYQHLGNLSPYDLDHDRMLRLIYDARDDSERTRGLDEFAWRADAEMGTARWSFVRDFGDSETAIRLVAIDCRASRGLGDEHRVMVDDHEWAWITERATQRPDGRPITHLMLGSTLPVLLPRGIHHLEGWNEEVGSGAHGRVAAHFAERMRQFIDMEHWSAFRTSFARMVDLLREVTTAPEPPASVLFLSGDVHCSYTARAHIADTEHSATVIRQLTMSPFRNPLPKALRLANTIVDYRPLLFGLRRLSRWSGVADTGLDWSLDYGPMFTNGVMTVVFDGRDAWVEIDRAEHEGEQQRLSRSADLLVAGTRTGAHTGDHLAQLARTRRQRRRAAATLRVARVVAVGGAAGMAVIQTGLAAGLPWGRAAWGGGHSGVLPPALRVASAASVGFWAGAAVVATDGPRPRLRRIARLGMAGFSAFSVLPNLLSPSAPERIWGPVAGALALAFGRLAREPRPEPSAEHPEPPERLEGPERTERPEPTEPRTGEA